MSGAYVVTGFTPFALQAARKVFSAVRGLRSRLGFFSAFVSAPSSPVGDGGLGGLFTSSLFFSSLGNGEVTLPALPASLPFELALCFATRFAVKARLFAVSPLCRSKFGSEIPSSEMISQPTLAIAFANPVTPAMRSSNAALTPGALPSRVC